ncbi:MAG: glycosyltransferase family 4 protein [Salinivirgaceae bacterium]|nr:glycosyltransferase family 4 protein [Salinivirgaceae bacterium]
MNKIQSTTNLRVHRAIKDSDVVVCATTEWQNYVEKLAGKKHHSKILYRPENCINRTYPINYSKFNSKTIDLVFVGWIDSRKALVLILDALKRMKDTSKVSLHILGDGDLIEKYKAYTSINGLDSVVNWHGRVPREEVFEIMNNSHLMVLPSLMDANTTVIWEAMAMGIPTLALDHFGFHDTIKNGETGFLIKPNNYRQVVNDIASVLIKLQQSNGMSLLRSMAENVLENRKKYLWEEREKFFESVYTEAINNHKNRGK